MKTTSLLLTFCLGVLFLFACAGNSGGEEAAQEQMDTTITVSIDTMIMFDPATYEETMSITERRDTTVTNEAGEVIYQSPRPERMMKDTSRKDTM